MNRADRLNVLTHEVGLTSFESLAGVGIQYEQGVWSVVINQIVEGTPPPKARETFAGTELPQRRGAVLVEAGGQCPPYNCNIVTVCGEQGGYHIKEEMKGIYACQIGLPMT